MLSILIFYVLPALIVLGQNLDGFERPEEQPVSWYGMVLVCAFTPIVNWFIVIMSMAFPNKKRI